MNHYIVLGVSSDADDRAIRRAFRSLVRRYHPDAGAGSSPEKFRLLVDAYETLIDPVRRRDYDRSLHPVSPPIPMRVKPMAVPVEPLAPPRPSPAPVFVAFFDRFWYATGDDFFRRRPFFQRW
jgi:curved DNA-binding protein CbpA